jgi:hypothetical protein
MSQVNLNVLILCTSVLYCIVLSLTQAVTYNLYLYCSKQTQDFNNISHMFCSGQCITPL